MKNILGLFTDSKIFLMPWVVGVGFLVSFLAFPSPALAVETYQEGTTLFSDDFNDGNYNGWTIESGTWLVDSAKQLTGYQSGKLKSGRIGNGSTWDNYRIEVDVKNQGGIDEGIGFRRSDGNNGYEVNLRHGTGQYNTPEIKLIKIQSGTTTQLFSTHSIPLTNNVAYHVKIEAVKEHIQMWLDGTMVFDLDDTGTTVKNGPISLSYWTGDYGLSNIRFDNVKVTSLSKQLYPVIFIPGIGGSEFKTAQDIVWSKDDGHGGTYSHAYPANETVWVNESEAASLGNDDYFDILKLKVDGVTPEAELGLTGNLTPFGYDEIDSFFQDTGYTKGTNFFVFPYDWRKDIRTTESVLDALVDEAKQKSGQPKVNIVAHSMGGLVARNYIINTTQAAKVNKLIELGVPHLGSPKALKALNYGDAVTYKFYSLKIPIIPSAEVKDIFSNFTSVFTLLPSKKYFDFYNNSSPEYAYPFFDQRDIDNNDQIGALNFDQINTLLKNIYLNSSILDLANSFHAYIEPIYNQTNNTKLYNIIGSSQPTLGQIKETWWITWPINLIPRREEIFINGDGTVPLYSASLKNDSKDLSANATLYYVEQEHSDLVRSSGTAMQTVKAILNEGDAIPIEVKSEKISLEGKQISIDEDSLDLYDDSNNHTGVKPDGEVEINIPKTYFSSIEKNKTVFIKKTAGRIKVKITPTKTRKAGIKVNHYTADKITKTAIYKDVPATKDVPIEFTIDPAATTSPGIPVGDQIIGPTSEVEGESLQDSNPPATTVNISDSQDSSGNYTSGVTVAFTSTDSGSGVLATEYSLDNGTTVQTYTSPFQVTTPGEYTLQVKSTDKLGNEEMTQSTTFKIIPQNTPSTDSESTTSNSSVSGSTSSIDTPTTSSQAPQTIMVLGTKMANPVIDLKESPTETIQPSASFDQSVLGEKTENKETEQTSENPNKNFYTFLVVALGILGTLSVTFVVSFAVYGNGSNIRFRK